MRIHQKKWTQQNESYLMGNNRYIRQTLLSKIGEKGQDLLTNSTVAIVGCGGLGSIAGPYLAGAGVGHLILIDGDVPDLTNLHRQVFFSEDIDHRTKAAVLSAHISKLNSDIKLTVIDAMISKENIDDLLQSADIVLECTDNVQAKYLVNDYCNISNIPMVYGAIHKYDGFLSLFENKDEHSIHLRDIFPVPNTDIPSCSEVGVLGTIAGMIGLMQSNEAIKYITKIGECMIGRLLSYDILTNNQMKLKLKKSYTQNMNDLYSQSAYQMDVSCTINEISYQEIIKNRNEFELISILPDNEHRNIDDEVIRMPLNEIDIDNWSPISGKPHVFYCISGKRSSGLVNLLESVRRDVEVFSLIGGLRGVKGKNQQSEL